MNNLNTRPLSTNSNSKRSTSSKSSKTSKTSKSSKSSKSSKTSKSSKSSKRKSKRKSNKKSSTRKDSLDFDMSRSARGTRGTKTSKAKSGTAGGGSSKKDPSLDWQGFETSILKEVASTKDKWKTIDNKTDDSSKTSTSEGSPTRKTTRPRSKSRAKRGHSQKALRLLGVDTKQPALTGATASSRGRRDKSPMATPPNSPPIGAGGSIKGNSRAAKLLGISSDALLAPVPLGSLLDSPASGKDASLPADWYAKQKEALAAAGASDPKTTPYEGEESSDDLILVNSEDSATGRPEVKAGTLEKLVERLTYEKYPDAGYVATFLLTYHSFTSSLELVELLIDRYNVDPRPGENEKDFKEKRQTPIRLRVANVFKTWINTYYDDFEHDAEVVKRVKQFMDGDLNATNPQLAKVLKSVLGRKEAGDSRISFSFSEPPPKPYLPSNLSSSLVLLDIHPQEVARQLTLIESELFRKILPSECQNQAWNTKGREENAPNILNMIRRFNSVSRAVSTSILRCETEQLRAVTINRWLVVAEKCRALNNFNAIMEILAGLSSSSVHRLKKTFGLLPQKSMDLYDYLSSLMSRENNFKNFRSTLHQENPPVVPYLGVYLTDLTFIASGNPDKLNGLINFNKCRKTSAIIREILMYQDSPYNLAPVEYVQNFLTNFELLDDNALHELSLQREPKVAAPSK